jgi:acylphosphatase
MMAAMSEVRCRLVVSGRVQGVFFRRSCAGVAGGLGVRGWVRNRADGAVEVVAEGARDAVGELVAWCHHGPPGAAVVAVEIVDEAPQGEVGFRVR